MRMLTVHLNRCSLGFFVEVVIALLLIGLYVYGASPVIAQVAAAPERATRDSMTSLAFRVGTQGFLN